jgi:amidase
MKPTRGRTPTGPEHGEYWRGFVTEHVLTRSVRDSAAILDAIAGADAGAPYLAPPQARPFLDEVAAEPGTLRIAVTSKPFLGSTVHDDCLKGLDATSQLLRDLGHEVIDAAPDIDGQAFAVAFLTIVCAEARADIEHAAALAGRSAAHGDFEATTYALGLLGKTMRASEYATASRVLQSAARGIGRFFEQYDVLLTPTLSAPPVLVGSLQPRGADRLLINLVGRLNAAWLLEAFGAVTKLAAETYEYTPWTPVFNVTGQPAMSLPLHWNDAGLPIGMHFVGRFGDEATLFRLAGQFERAQPWASRIPAV